MKDRVIFGIWLLLISILLNGILFGGTTGKITGVITDASTSAPIIGANVILKGTTMGAASDSEGNFTILNVPPGTYTVVISMIGYQQIQFEDVRVSIDLTTRLDATLKQTALDLGESVIVTAERKLVLRDMTSSLSTIDADQISNLPVQQIQDVLRLNAGIIESDGRLHIRGGRAGEVAYWVDGISATDVYDGRIGINIENSAVQELQVISGTFNAEYGQAMSGIVNIITKEGGQDYTGYIKVYGGDYVSDDNVFGLYKRILYDSTRSNILSKEWENPLKKINPIYNGEFSLGGPVPLFKDNLSFFINGRYYYDEGYYYGRTWYQPNGAPIDSTVLTSQMKSLYAANGITFGGSSLVPMNPMERTTFQGKLSARLSRSMKLNYNFFWNESYQERAYFRINTNDYQFNPTGTANYQQFNTHDYKYNPYGLPQIHNQGMAHTLTLNHIINPSNFYELRVSRYESKSKQYVFDNPNASNDYLVYVKEDTSKDIIAEIIDPFTERGAIKFDSLKYLGAQYEYIVNPEGSVGYIDPDDITAPTSYSFMNSGMDVTRANRKTAYWVGKLDFTSQINKYNQLKFGSEVRLYELTLHSYQIVAATNESGQELTPFQPAIPEVGSVYRNDYFREPKELSAYIQDKLERNNIILNVGIRYDYFDANSVILADPIDPNIYSPFKYSNKYANWIDMPNNYRGTIDQWVDSLLASGTIREYTPDERRAFMHKKVKAKSSWSPRLGLAFPITDRGVIHISYGHFFQVPEFQYLYTNPDFKVTTGSGAALFGNPDLKPQKTVMYEIGLQQQFGENIGIDLTLFYRDVRDWVGTSPIIQTVKTGVSYSQFVNKDYSNVRGVTFKIEKRFSQNYSFRADYTYQSAEGTYSDPTDAFNSALNNEQPVLALVPMEWDQRHTVNAQIIYDVSGWTFSLIGRYWSGRPYTPSFPSSETVGGAAVSGLTTNSARRPSQRNIDLTLNKILMVKSKFRLELFANIYNVLDIRDELNVYTDTGTADYTTTINPKKVVYSPDRVSTVEDYIKQPTWYTSPRQIQVGLAIGFN